MVRPKPKSKRTPVRLRHKIEKASSAKQRKQRKLAKKNPEWRSRLKKDPGIPNLFPYKDRILHEIEEKRRAKEVEITRKRDEARARRRGDIVNGTDVEGEIVEGGEVMVPGAGQVDNEGDEMVLDDADDADEDETQNPMAALLASAKARSALYEDVEETNEEKHAIEANLIGPEISIAPLKAGSSRKAFDKVFKQVVDSADVVLYVLDARDPEGTRSKEVERMVTAAEAGQKRLILVLNKIDLIPRSALVAWMLHLRRSFPTLPLRASGPAANAQTFNHPHLTVQSTSSTLFKALKAFAHSRQLKRSVTVGVIGYPNVGKSSVINALTSRLGGSTSACPTGAEAGVTTSLREVKLDGKLKLLDSPGIVFPNSTADGSRSEEQARLVLLNAVPPKQIEDPVPAVSLLLRRLSQSQQMLDKLTNVYGLKPLLSLDGDPTMDFLTQVCRRRGRLGKGGVPNIHSAATTVITDWRDGRIQGWMDPPLDPAAAVASRDPAALASGNQDQKVIVTEWAKEFQLEGLFGDGQVDVQDEAMHN